MRVSTKMTLCLSATYLVIAVVLGRNQLRREDQEAHKETEREMRLLGTSVKVAVENALRDRQFADIQETLDSLDIIDPDVDILVFDLERRLKAGSTGSVAIGLPEQLVTASMKNGETTLRFDETAAPGRILLSVALINDDGSPLGGLVLVRPLDEMRKNLADSRRGIVLSVMLVVLAATALQFALGTIYVTRPLTAMASAMRRLRAGDLSTPVADPPRDEVGALAREFGAMVVDLREARERIAREVESRTSLEQGLQRVDKLVTIGQLSAGLAHEIGSPLQILNGRARALLSREHAPEEVRKIAEVLAAQTDRIAGIVEQLLMFSRRKPVRLAEIDLRGPVQAILDLMEHTARRQGVVFQLVCGEALPRVVADVDQIQQVVLNLLKNALEATGKGGRISIRLEAGTLEIAERDRGIAAARIVVSDTGCGIPAATLPKLFEPFFTTRAAQGGTGLGLAVVKAIVTEHGGGVSARSKPGEGSVFTVELPVRGPVGTGEIMHKES